MKRPRLARPRDRAGFTLIEMVIAMVILAALAGIAMPVMGTVTDQRYRSVTRAELDTLSAAAVSYFEDTGQLPGKVKDLLVAPSGVAGWTGPYLPGALTDTVSGALGYEVDGWSRKYTVKVVKDVLTMTSAGADGKPGTSDDIARDTDVTSVRRSETRDRLDVLNQAVQQYNAQYLVSKPLSTSYSQIYSALVAEKLVPADARYQTDAWGDAFVPDPAATLPVVRLTSKNLTVSGDSGGSAGDDKDKKKKKDKKEKSKGGNGKGADKGKKKGWK